MRWPGSWKSPSAVGLLKGTPINWLLIDKDAGLAPVIEQAKQSGLQVAEIAAPPAGVTILPGEWPGVAMARGGASSAGPTGVPWVDTNSWKIRLEALRRPGDNIWVDAAPKSVRISASSYRTAIADAAAHGGRWVISLDAQLAAGIADNNPNAAGNLEADYRRRRLLLAAQALDRLPSRSHRGHRFRLRRRERVHGPGTPQPDRPHQPAIRGLIKDKTARDSFSRPARRDLRRCAAPAPELRKQILDFVTAGGLLITGPKWGVPPGMPARDEHPALYQPHPRQGPRSHRQSRPGRSLRPGQRFRAAHQPSPRASPFLERRRGRLLPHRLPRPQARRRAHALLLGSRTR